MLRQTISGSSLYLGGESMKDDLKWFLLRTAYEPALALSTRDKILYSELSGIVMLQELGYIKMKSYTGSFVVARAWLTELGESFVKEIPSIDCIYIILEHEDWEYNKSLLRHYMTKLSREELPAFLVSTNELVRSLAKAIYDKGEK